MGTIAYNDTTQSLGYIYRATSGGTVFSSNYVNNTAFDYFTDTAVVNDAIYFSNSDTYLGLSDLTFNIGTPLVATSIVIKWERYVYDSSTGTYNWEEIDNCQDDTNMFQNSGSVAFKFGLKYDWRKTSVNGVSRFWVRARIDSVSGLTEGGANSTSVVTMKDGRIRINDYTDSSPCRLSSIYNYMTTYFPYVGITKTVNHYNFTNAQFYCLSPLAVYNESFEIGMGTNPGQSNLYYLQMGTKVGDYFGRNGGTLIVNAPANSYPVNFNSSCKIYGSNFLSPSGAGYPGILGEWVDTNFDNINISPQPSATILNCRFYNPGTWICGSGWFGTFDRCKVLVAGHMGYFYNTNVALTNLDYEKYGSSGNIFYLYQTRSPVVFSILNPNPALPSIYDTGWKPVARDVGSFGTFINAFFYDSSAGTYTDYTTEFGSTTTDDAPIDGDVGDYYLFNVRYTYVYGPALEILTNLTSNDYEYVFEKYSGGTWKEITTVWDQTNNFTTNGNIYLYLTNNYNTVTINGISGCWLRMRIVTKGTGSPKITRLRYVSQGGISDWTAYENYTIDVNVKDESNVAIENATVSISLNGSEVYSGQTDSNGDMAQQTLTSKYWYFDPINYPDNYHQIAEVVNGNYIMTISKNGYETYKTEFTLNEKKELQLVLKTSIENMVDTDGELYQKLNPSNEGAFRDMLMEK